MNPVGVSHAVVQWWPSNSTLASAVPTCAATQAELAANTGIALQSIINYENGRREPNARAIVALEQYFDITAAALLGLEDADSAARRADEPDKSLALSETETSLLRDFRSLSTENQTTLLRLAAKFAAIDKALNAWLDADDEFC